MFLLQTNVARVCIHVYVCVMCKCKRTFQCVKYETVITCCYYRNGKYTRDHRWYDNKHIHAHFRAKAPLLLSFLLSPSVSLSLSLVVSILILSLQRFSFHSKLSYSIVIGVIIKETKTCFNLAKVSEGKCTNPHEQYQNESILKGNKV